MSGKTDSADSGADRTSIPDQEKLAEDLAIEICLWLKSFDASDAECQKAVECAGFELDQKSTFWEEKYLFQPYQVTLDVIGIWNPLRLSGDDEAFRKTAGHWLATWISFWIAEPEIWNRAIDLSCAVFGERAQAA